MTFLDLILLLCMMSAISFGMRFLPFLFSKQLHQWKGIKKLSTTLPAVIIILLVAHTLERVPFSSYPFGLPEMTALVGVIGAQCLFRRVLLSMGVGILFQQVLLHVI